MLETKRTWGEVGGGLREERTDDPGIVSKSFRAAFFPSSLSLSKKHGRKREREREKVRTVGSFEKVSRSGGEEGVERRRRKQTGWSILARWKNYGQR